MSEQPILQIILDRQRVEVTPPPAQIVEVIEDTIPGRKGDKGDPGTAGGAVLEITLVVPQTEVTVNHGFTFKPGVRYVTAAGDEVDVAIDHPTIGVTVLSSVIPMLGTITVS